MKNGTNGALQLFRYSETEKQINIQTKFVLEKGAKRKLAERREGSSDDQITTEFK